MIYPIEPLKLEKNRVWRTYKGGKALGEWLGEEEPEDSYYPEEWISSTVKALNPNNTINKSEGYCSFKIAGNKKEKLIDFIKSNPKLTLGESHLNRFGKDSAVLMKLLDAAERLTIQVHPSKEKAKTLFQSPFGKTEAWYIMEGRDIEGEPPHIFVGFKTGITKKLIIELFENQDIEKMLSLMNKIYVKPGEVYLIPGGLVHAIGKGCFMMEIQEATDYTIRLERTNADGINIDDMLVHQGLGFEKMFECIDMDSFSDESYLNKIKLIDEEFTLEGNKTLISYKDTECFALKKYNIFKDKLLLKNDETFSTLIITAGKGVLKWNNKSIKLYKGDKIFLPYICDNIEVLAYKESLSFLRCYPPYSQGGLFNL